MGKLLVMASQFLWTSKSVDLLFVSAHVFNQTKGGHTMLGRVAL
jgi:hypothetical protein